MPSSPVTPTPRRHSSGVDPALKSASPQSSGHNLRNKDGTDRQPYHSCDSSLYSIPSPSTPRPLSSYDGHGGFVATNGFGNVSDSGKGLGNLADELAEAWDAEVEVDADEGYCETHRDQRELIGNKKIGMLEELQHESRKNVSIDNEFPASSSSAEPSAISSSPQTPSTRIKHRRQNSHYDGSEYGDDTDFEDAIGISPSLEARMATVDILARQGTESNGSDADVIVLRVAQSLKDLGSQSSLEQSATR
ncbi:hypothetical protein MMC07_009442 [Pseudocyphellaria aurata]|nr:hypothetical protein [Pseudocyphellaria aurata]